MEEELFTYRRSNLTLIFLLAICIFLLTAHLSGSVRGFKNILFYIISPTPEAATRIIQSGQRLSQNVRELVRVHQENVELRRAIEKYTLLENEWERTREQNVRLRQLVDFPMPAAQRSVVARVVTREPGSWFQWVIIDRGRAEGLFVNAPVLAWAGDKPAVLGRVGEVFDHSAKVVLITSVISSLPVKVTSCEQDGLMEGQNNTRMKLNYLLPESKITIGDEVVTSSLSTVFPPGIRVGYIHDYMGNESDAYRSAVVKPAVNFNSLREVAVLIPENR